MLRILLNQMKVLRIKNPNRNWLYGLLSPIETGAGDGFEAKVIFLDSHYLPF